MTISIQLAVGAPVQKANVKPWQKRLRVMTQRPRFVIPVRMAYVDRNLNQVSPWIYTSDMNNWPGGPWCTVFDSCEISPANPPNAPNGEPYENPNYGPLIWSPPTPSYARFWFDAPYKNPFFVNDMDTAELYGGSLATRVAFDWYWNPETNPLENMIVVVGTAETFSTSVAGFPPPQGGGPNNLAFQTYLGGVAFDFGNNMGAGWAPGRYFFNIDVGTPPTPLEFKMPQDGSGACIVQILNSLNPATLASRAQPMIWMAKQARRNLPLGNPSGSGEFQWDDDMDIATGANIPDGRHLTDPPGPANRVERYSYAPPLPGFPQVTDNLGAAVAFYSNMLALAIESFNVQFGNLISGNLASLRRSDDSRLNFFADESASTVAMELRTTAPATTTTRMRVIWEVSAGVPEYVQSLFLYNFQTNAFEGVDGAIATPTDTQRIANVTGDPSRFINPTTREIRARLSLGLSAESVPADGWALRIDRLTVEVDCP